MRSYMSELEWVAEGWISLFLFCETLLKRKYLFLPIDPYQIYLVDLFHDIITISSTRKYSNSSSMKSGKIVIVIILLTLLFALAQSEPRKRGRFAKKDQSSFKKRMEPQFTILDIIFGKDYLRKNAASMIMIMFFGGLFGIAVFIESCRRALRKKKDKILEEIHRGFKESIPEELSDFPEDERQSILYDITYSAMNNIHFKDDDQKEYTCKLREGRSEEITQDMYALEFKANDLKGSSKIGGVLIFSNTGLKLKLCKVYEHIELSYIFGPFNAYIFEGQGNAKEISGQWRKHGQQNRSGTFKMLKN